MGSGELRQGAAALARRPDLWLTALATGWRLLPRGWWRHWPPRPAPPPGYLAFRRQTYGGRTDASLTGPELVAYLEWCRRMPRSCR